eukprot:PhM_4_TR2067/c0_g1_i1/m.99907
MAKHFSEPAKDLISKMMVVDPMQRVTLEQILSHPWFMVGFDRKAVTDYSNATTLAPSQQQIQNWATNETETTTQTPKPTAPAEQQFGAFEIIARLTSGAFSSLVSAGKAGSNIVVKRATRFVVGGNRSEAVQKIQSCLDAFKKGDAAGAPGAKPKEGQKDLEIKGFFNAPKGLL